MKKLFKKVLLILLSTILAISSFACNNSGKNSGVELVDFPATIQESVLKGEIYTITLRSVKDTNGKKYFTKYTVKTKSGADVQVLGGQFDILDESGYIITYTITLDDDTTKTCVATLNCVEEGAIRIELPTNVPNASVGVPYAVPTAQVYINNQLSTTKPNVTATFVANYTYKKIEKISLTDFVPETSGKIVVTYSTSGALVKNLEIPVDPATPSQTHALDLSSSDVLGYMQLGSNNDPSNALEYVANGVDSYVRWFVRGNGFVKWQNLKIQSSVSDSILDSYTHIRVKMKAISDTGTYRWRAFMCSDGYITGPEYTVDGATSSKERLALNEWNDIYLPVSVFKAGGNGFDKLAFISLTFNSPLDSNADNIKEVHFAGFDLVNIAITSEKSSYIIGEAPSFTISGSIDKDCFVEIRQGNTVVETLSATDNTYTWSNSNSLQGAFKACLIAEDRVVTSFAFGVGIEPITIFTPTETNYTLFTCTGNEASVKCKSGANGDYAGNFLSITTSIKSDKWYNVYFDLDDSQDYSKYNNIEIWVYLQSKGTGTASVSFFDDTAYKRTVEVNGWHKITIDAKAFTEMMGRTTLKNGNSSTPYKNWLCSVKLNANTVYGLYFGTITATI